MMIKQSVLLLVIVIQVKTEEWDVYDLVDSLGCHDYASLIQGTGPMYQLSDNKSGPYTIFAPTDDAFTHVPDYIAKIFNYGNWELAYDIVTYHITYGNITLGQFRNEMLLPTWQGEKLRFNIYDNLTGDPSYMAPNGGKIIKSGKATNGMVYVIDRVLYNIPRVTMDMFVQEQRNLTNLQMLMDVSGIQEVLRSQNLTLLAPSDAAFDKVPAMMKSLVGNATLAKELFNHHLINSTYYSVGLIDGLNLTNVNQQRISVKNNGTAITVNGAEITAQDMAVTNGVVQVIDSVLFQI